MTMNSPYSDRSTAMTCGRFLQAGLLILGVVATTLSAIGLALVGLAVTKCDLYCASDTPKFDPQGVMSYSCNGAIETT